MKHGSKAALIICLILAAAMQIAFAGDSSMMSLDNTRIITSDKDATFVEGEVSVATGQTIVIKAGLRTIAEKKMPDTNAPARFKIKIPAGNISSKKTVPLFVNDKSTDERPVRVEVEYIERRKQEISTEKTEYQLTFPGEDAAINAEASSGERLVYSSSDPEVADVDAAGNIITKGGGEAEISVRQIGSSAYEEAEETLKVSVEAIDAYSVTFHSSDKENASAKQIIPTGASEPLKENSFENGDHKFLGWATEDGGIVELDDAEDVQDLAEKGENTDLYAVWTGDGAAAALAWAIDIANDDSFTYGKKPAANAIGCYFCGTNCGPVKKNKPKGYEKTYVCLTFVGAAYAHGAEDPEIYYACSHGKMPLYENDDNFSKFSCWTKVGKCKNLSISDLKPGDVVINWSAHNDNNGHVWMYAGDDKIVESTGGGFTAKSISLKNGAASRLRSYGSNNLNYVMRYTGENAQ